MLNKLISTCYTPVYFLVSSDSFSQKTQEAVYLL